MGEFVFHKTLPPPGARAFGKIYERVDRPDLSIEHWQHLHGCRGWLLVRRNPSTGSVLETRLLGDHGVSSGGAAPGPGSKAIP